MSKMPIIFVFSDKKDRLPEIIAGARALGEDVCAFVVGTDEDAQYAASLGAGVVYTFAPQEGVMLEDYAPSFAAVVAACGKKAMVLVPPSKRGRALAARMGVQLGAAVANEVTRIEIADAVTVSRMVFGGLASGSERITSPVCVLSLASGSYEPATPDASLKAELKQGVFVSPAVMPKVVGLTSKQGSSVDLCKAKRVLCVGRGFAKKEDLALAENLASAIGAELGCSRPVAEGEGWMERERYIGVSGVMLKADVYFAVGVSGQIQHMVGANGSKVIIAVSKDKNAPIFNFVDYGIVGDLYKVLPGLTSLLK